MSRKTMREPIRDRQREDLERLAYERERQEADRQTKEWMRRRHAELERPQRARGAPEIMGADMGADMAASEPEPTFEPWAAQLAALKKETT